MSVIGQNPKSSSSRGENWLSAEAFPYGSEGFGRELQGKLSEMSDSGGQASSVMGLHYSNVALSYAHQFGLDVENKGANAAVVSRSGQQGSETEIRVPQLAAMAEKAWNIIVGPELAWSAVPSTTDFASLAKAVTARNSLQYYWTFESAGALVKLLAHDAMFYGEGMLHVPWDKSLGKDVDVDETNPERPRPIRSGDMRFTTIPTWDTLRDRAAKSFDQQGVFVFREWQNKYDRAAMCETNVAGSLKPDATPEQTAEAFEKAAQRAARCKNASSQTEIGASWAPLGERYDGQSDVIPVYYLYAKRTPSVPAGRQTVFLEDGTILEDGPLDEAYAVQMPLIRMQAGEYRGTPWPYSKVFACMGSSQATDALYAALLTNAVAVSGPVVSVEDDNIDAGMAIATLDGGPQVVPRPKGTQAPEVLQLHAAHPEHFKLAQTMRNEDQQIIGLDALTAGQEIGANLSGAAMVMMTSTSVQNNSQLQASYRDAAQATGNVVLKHIQFHMTEKKRIALAGNSRSSLVSTTEVSGADVQGIERITCTIGGAMRQTDAGKYELATTALKEGWAQTPEQFQTVMDTGNLDTLSEDLSNELLLIQSEMEALARGEEVPVTPYDNHVLHIKRERAVIASLTARRNVAVLKAVQKHLDDHVLALKTTDPFILSTTNQPVLSQEGGSEPGAAPMGPEQPGIPANGAPPPGVPTPQAPKDPVTREPVGPVAGEKPPAMLPKKPMPVAA